MERSAIVVAIVGFSWGGWVTASTAETMAFEMAKLEVAALLPICVAQSAADPDSGARLSELKETRNYQRADILIKTGEPWACERGFRASGDACLESWCQRMRTW